MNHLFRFAVSLLLLYAIGHTLDWTAVAQALQSLSPWTMAAAFCLLLASSCTAALRWSVIMRTLGMPAAFSFYLASYFKGIFFNQGLPTSIGGDALRILDVARIASSKEDAFFGVLIDRLIGVAGLIVLNIGALLFGWGILAAQAELSLAALLAIIGYSLNDTIVVADRIRENFRTMRVGDSWEIINTSIHQTIARTINTSGTTLVVLIALYVFGGEAINGFALALIIGVVVGTYSSIYVSANLLLALGVSREDLALPIKEGVVGQKEEDEEPPEWLNRM